MSQFTETVVFKEALRAARDHVRRGDDVTLMHSEDFLLASDPMILQAHCRQVASRLRIQVADIEAMLGRGMQIEAAGAAHLAREALTQVISATCQDEDKMRVFACKR